MIKLKIATTIICLALCLVFVMFVKALLAQSFVEVLANLLGLNALVELLLRLLTKYYYP